MHGQFIKETTVKVNKEKMWKWLSRGKFKGWNKSIVMCRTGANSQDKLHEVPHR